MTAFASETTGLPTPRQVSNRILLPGTYIWRGGRQLHGYGIGLDYQNEFSFFPPIKREIMLRILDAMGRIVRRGPYTAAQQKILERGYRLMMRFYEEF